MADYTKCERRIPWASVGRKSIAHMVGRSLVPVGVLPFQPVGVAGPASPMISQDHPEWEKFLMHIVGTAIHGGDHRFVTCLHVMKALGKLQRSGYFLSRLIRGNDVTYIHYRIEQALKYVDPRSNQVNADVDLAVFISSAFSTPEIPFDIPVVKWGDSTKLGAGDSVLVGGYPYGTDMFKFVMSNRGIIQPTFYQGIVSAILPATRVGETRLIQLSVPCAGGTSGGAVFDPRNGKVLGMVTSGIQAGSGTLRVPQPITYAIPSEVIAPFVRAISFETKSGKKY
jgi:hypothetical protein